MTETKKDLKYSLRQCRKNAEMHKANGLAAELQADKTKKSFWQKVNNKNRSSSLPTLVGVEMVVQWLLKCGKSILKEYWTLKTLAMGMGLQSLWKLRLQGELSGSWNAHVLFCLLSSTSSKAALEQISRAWLVIVFLQSTCCMQMNLCVFFSVNCLTCVLFTGIYPIPV